MSAAKENRSQSRLEAPQGASWCAFMVEAAPFAMLMIDRQRIIALVNRRCEDLFGYRRDELVGQPVELLVPERAREQHVAQVASYLGAPRARAMGAARDLFGRHKTGAEIAIDIGLSPIELPEGGFTLASVLDVTERRRMEEEIRRSNAELEQFAYVASHDLQQPLRMIAGFTELLARRYRGKLDDKADQYIFQAVDGARRMQRLISDLLAYSRIGSHGRRLVPVAAGAVVGRVIQVLAPAIQEAQASLEVGDLPTVIADEDQLGRLFQNLVANALKFRGEAPPRIRIEARLETDRWRFSVADNGIGIETRHGDRIFQMFQRLHEPSKFDGSGIGLAVVKRIVERHGGQIWFESTPGAGATFFFTLSPG